jgi:hypothetical protein
MNGSDLRFLFSVSGGLHESGQVKVVQVNEQEDLSESVSTKSSSDTDSSDNMVPTASNTSSPS